MTNTETISKPTVGSGASWSTDLVITAAAVICAMFLWLSAVQLGGVDLVVGSDDEARHISGMAVALSAGVAAMLGLTVLRGLERLMSKALQVWTVVAVLVTALSALGPLSATSSEVVGALLGLHGVVAAVVILGARRSR